MRVAFICGFAWEPKGTARSRAFPLAAELVKKGHEVTLFLMPYDNLEYSGKEWVSDGVCVRNLVVDGKSGRSFAAMVGRLHESIREYAPDLVHIFKPKGFAGIAALLLGRKHQIVLDCDDWEGWGGWNEVTHYPWIIKEYIDRQEKWLIRRVPVVTAASRVLVDRAERLRETSSGVFYVPNCLTTERVQSDSTLMRTAPEEDRKALGLATAPLVFYAGHFDPADDLEFLCRAISPVLMRENAAIAFAGDGPKLQSTKNFFARLNIQVHFFGRLSFERYAQLLNAADVATFPFPDNAVYRAKCSVRILDFMSFGKAILTTAVGQNPEYLIHGDSGFLVPAGDEQAYRAGLEFLLENTEVRERLGRNARQRVASNFLWHGSSLDACLKAYNVALASESILAPQCS